MYVAPMPPHLTPTAEVIDLILRKGGSIGVVDLVMDRVASKISNSAIAKELRDRTGKRVSHESVRLWALEWASTDEVAS